MSFSKAKIQRFNEIHSCAPAPSAYNPKVQVNLTGAVIPKSERFITESPAHSIHSADNASVASGNGSIFRTPSLNKKKKVNVQLTPITPKGQLFTTEDCEALQEKIVECMNKDESIKDLAVQIEELKDQISHLEIQQHQLNIENQQYEVNLHKIKTQCERLMSQQAETHEKQISALEETARTTQCELEEKMEEIMQIKRESNEELLQLKANIDLLQKLQNDLKEQHRKEIEMLEEDQQKACEKIQRLEETYEGSMVALTELQRSHSEEIEQLKNQHLLEVQDIEYEMLKCVTDSQKCVELNKNEVASLQEIIQHKDNLIADMKRKIHLLERDFEARLKLAEENSAETMKLAEIQMEERCEGIAEDWMLKLKEQQTESDAILQECQAIGEFNVIQCELEKNQLKKELQNAEDRMEELRTSTLEESNCLKEKLDRAAEELQEANVELQRTTEEFQQQLNLQEVALAKARTEKRTYEVSYKKALETVEALKNRLINSDKDVEQLKEELGMVEAAKLETEEKYNVLLDELCSITKEKDELLKKNDNFNEYVSETVANAEKGLLAKLDEFQEVAKKEQDYLRAIVAEKDAQQKLALEQLAEQQQLNKEAFQLISNVKVELEQSESENTELKYAKSRLEASVERLHQEVNESSEIHRKYIEQSGKIDALQHKVEELKLVEKELKKMVMEQKNMIDPYRDQLEEYEAERLALMAGNTEAQHELRQLNLRYAEALGHHNAKQKIKHLVDLKQKNLALSNAAMDREIKIKKQAFFIEKLKKELAEKNTPKKSTKANITLPNSDKENVSPLKQRNLH